MKHNLFLLISAIAFTSVLFSCDFTAKPKEITINDKFKLMVPGYMRPQNKLNEEASMAYMNDREGVYVIVIEDSYESIYQLIVENDREDEYIIDFDGFCQLACRQEGDYLLTRPDYKKLQDGTINGLKARFFENTRTINHVNAFYKLALIEGKDTYYQVTAWTLSDKKNKHKETLEKIIHSFEELQ